MCTTSYHKIAGTKHTVPSPTPPQAGPSVGIPGHHPKSIREAWVMNESPSLLLAKPGTGRNIGRYPPAWLWRLWLKAPCSPQNVGKQQKAEICRSLSQDFNASIQGLFRESDREDCHGCFPFSAQTRESQGSNHCSWDVHIKPNKSRLSLDSISLWCGRCDSNQEASTARLSVAGVDQC